MFSTDAVIVGLTTQYMLTTTELTFSLIYLIHGWLNLQMLNPRIHTANCTYGAHLHRNHVHTKLTLYLLNHSPVPLPIPNHPSSSFVCISKSVVHSNTFHPKTFRYTYH